MFDKSSVPVHCSQYVEASVGRFLHDRGESENQSHLIEKSELEKLERLKEKDACKDIKCCCGIRECVDANYYSILRLLVRHWDRGLPVICNEEAGSCLGDVMVYYEAILNNISSGEFNAIFAGCVSGKLTGNQDSNIKIITYVLERTFFSKTYLERVKSEGVDDHPFLKTNYDDRVRTFRRMTSLLLKSSLYCYMARVNFDSNSASSDANGVVSCTSLCNELSLDYGYIHVPNLPSSDLAYDVNRERLFIPITYIFGIVGDDRFNNSVMQCNINSGEMCILSSYYREIAVRNVSRLPLPLRFIKDTFCNSCMIFNRDTDYEFSDLLNGLGTHLRHSNDRYNEVLKSVNTGLSSHLISLNSSKIVPDDFVRKCVQLYGVEDNLSILCDYQRDICLSIFNACFYLLFNEFCDRNKPLTSFFLQEEKLMDDILLTKADVKHLFSEVCRADRDVILSV